jgi:hypothetical protein
MTRFGIITTLLIAGCLSSALAQDKYERKSISYIDALWLATPEARKVKPEQVSYMLDAIQERIEMPRFDYNPLPELLIKEFVDAANARQSLTIDELARLMEQKLTPRIVNLLDEYVNLRAGELVSAEKQAGFLATKAKELGITLDEIEKVMNSAYIYLPVLTGLKREDAQQKDRYIYTINGGIIWYHIDMSSGQPRVRLRVAQSTMSKGLGSDRFAYESAVDNFARNLEVATKSIAEFKLSTPIAEVDGGNITFPLGLKEGIKLDETFMVGEWVYGAGSDPTFRTDGWVKVGKVGDNTRSDVNCSSAWAIKKGSWARGMSVVEHPRLPIDIAIIPGAGHLSVSQGRIPILIGSDMYITEDYDTYAPGVDLDAHYNLAPLTGVRQSFFLIGGSFAWPATLEFESSMLTMLSSTPPFIWGLHCGYLKKFYFGQLALTSDARIGMKFFTVEQTFKYIWDEYKYTIKNNSLGVQFGLGVDWAATPDFNIGVQTAYKAYTVSDAWTLTIDPFLDGAILTWDDSFPEINHSGLFFGLYMHYTPPALSFDPISLIRGALGE